MRPTNTNYYGGGVDPRGIAGCSTWIDALDARTIGLSGSTPISQTDKSFSARSYTGGNRYTYNVTRFNTSYPSFFLNNSLSSPMIGSNTAATIAATNTFFAVGQSIGLVSGNAGFIAAPISAGNLRFFFSNVAGSIRPAIQGNAGVLIPASGNFTSPFVVAFVMDGTNGQIFVNGSSVVSGASTAIATGVQFGAYLGLNGFQGHLCEMISYNSIALSTQNRQVIEGYLAHKWGIQANLVASHPYRSARPFSRPVLPIEIATCEFWFDAADIYSIDRSGTSLITLSNKGSSSGSNITVTSGTPTTGVTTQNGQNCVTMSSSNDILQFSGTFATQVRTRFFAVRPKVATTSANALILLYQNAVNASGNDCILWNSSTLTELAQGVAFRMVSAAQANQSNVFGTYTFRNAAASGSNQISLNGTSLTLTTSTSAASYNTAASTWFINRRETGQPYSGAMDLGEIVSFNSQLTDVQTLQMEGYLAWKWGVVGSLPATHMFKSVPPIAGNFSPLFLSGCQLWLDAGDATSLTLSGSTVTAWRDKSGNGRNAAIAGSPQYTRPTRLNAPYAISFNGSSDSALVTYTVAQPYTIFVVSTQKDPVYLDVFSFVFNSTISTGAMLYYGDFPSTLIMAASATNSYPGINYFSGITAVYGAFFSGASSTLSYNGTLITGLSPGTNALTNLYFGRDWNAAFAAADVGEVIVYNRALSLFERQQIEGYLSWKWGLFGSLPSGHRYKNVRI